MTEDGIHPASREDLGEILAIEQASFPNPFTRDLFEVELRLKIAHLLVLKRGETVVGYMDFWHVADEMHLINIAVHPEKRRQGIATLLMDHLIAYAQEKGVRVIFLDVRVSNGSAIALYEKYGFKSAGVRKGYYKDNQEDAVVMKREF